MRTLGVPREHRHLSRLGFYLAVLLILWLLGRLETQQAAQIRGASSKLSDEELGVAPVYIASPMPPPEFSKIPGGR